MSRLVRPLLAAALANAAAACVSPSPIPPPDSPYAAAKLAEASALASVAAAPDLPSAARAVPPAPRAALDPVAGIVDLTDARVAAFTARLSAPETREAALAATPLDADLVLGAVWTLSPSVAAAKSDVDAARRAYEQASWLDDVESGFRSAAAPATNAREAMPSAPLAYPGAAALRGEMLDREVEMALARLRMRFLEAGTTALVAWHAVGHHGEELAIRRDQVNVLVRLTDVARSRVESGRAPQAELLEAQAELAMVRSDQEHAETALVAARRRLNAILDCPPDLPWTAAPHDDPPAATPDAPELLDLARRSSPDIAMARADAARLDAAERMARRMANPTAGPGAVAGGGMDGGMGPAAPRAPDVAPPAWAAEIAARRAAAERRVTEATRDVERRVADAVYELAAMARMFRVSSGSTEPATRQALDDRLRLYEGGRGEFPALLAAFRRHLDAMHDVAQARHDYGAMEAMLWMAVGARPGHGRHGEK